MRRVVVGRGVGGRGVVLAVVVAVVVVAGFAGASSAFAASAWWHLASNSRPSYVQPGFARDEVQEITTTTEPPFEGGTLVIIGESGVFLEPVTLGETAEEMQKVLEKEGAYGPGNVEVSGIALGVSPLVVRTIGARGGREVPQIEFFGAGIDEKTTVTTEGRPAGRIIVTAANVGDAGVDGRTVPVSLVDTLPAGLEAVSIEAVELDGSLRGGAGNAVPRVPCVLVTLACTFSSEVEFFEGLLPVGAEIEVRIGVDVKEGAESGEENVMSVSGGEGFTCGVVAEASGKFKDGACTHEVTPGEEGEGKHGNFERSSTGVVPSSSSRHPVTISSTATPFGVEDYELTPEALGGASATQAGSHPFQLTTTVVFNQAPGGKGVGTGQAEGAAAALAKDVNVKLPVGLTGNPTPFARCTLAEFGAEKCPPASVLGFAIVTANEPGTAGLVTITAPVFNLEPKVGEPARFGFLPTKETPAFLDLSVRTGEDYGVTVSSSNIPETAGVLSAEVTIWGVPGSGAHDAQRGFGCLEAGRGEATAGAKGALFYPACNPLEENNPPPFLQLPTSCGGPLQSTMQADSWVAPGTLVSLPSTEAMPAMDGCNGLQFAPSISLSPDSEAASTPTGLTVDVHVPQEEDLNAKGIAPSEVKNITVTLPEGLVLNPASADGLGACTEGQIALGNDSEPGCPNASKIANVTIHTPLLPHALTGFVYLASPQNFREGLQENPFSSLVAIYIYARDPVSGVTVKLPGHVTLSETGQITTTVADPQQPFEDAELEFFGGDRAPLATPAHCDPYITTASFAPWSGEESVPSSSTFDITSGVNEGACPGSSLSFSPSLTSGSPNINAGSFTPLDTTISREDGQQSIQNVRLHYPPGVSGLLSGIALCPEAQANAGTCGPESLIGETTVSVGLGGDPFTVTGGKVYLTEKYGGAPFGLSIVNPAKAGPFNLQEGKPVVVRAKIEINPLTTALTITTTSIPRVIEGFPLQIKHVNVTITRQGFTFNPTNCDPLAVTGTIAAWEGASAPVSVPFQVTNCATLKFAPKFTISTSGRTSKANGASLTVKLAYPTAPFGSQANIAKVKVDLPKQLPSRLTTLQKACLAVVFEANPAGCPASSIVGHARVITPLLPVPLTGPAYFVSHGGEAFPSLTIVLQGYGVTAELVGSTFIKNGVTSSTFKATPDVPFSLFELTLPEGKYSALAANANLCKTKLAMPTAFTAQNGAEIHQTNKITVTGCHKPKKASSKKSKKASKAKRATKTNARSR